MVRSHQLGSNRSLEPTQDKDKGKKVTQKQPDWDAEDSVEGTSAMVTTPNFTEEIRAIVQKCPQLSRTLSEPNPRVSETDSDIPLVEKEWGRGETSCGRPASPSGLGAMADRCPASR